MINAFFNEGRRTRLRAANARADGRLLKEGRGIRKPEPEGMSGMDEESGYSGFKLGMRSGTEYLTGGDDRLKEAIRTGWKGRRRAKLVIGTEEVSVDADDLRTISRAMQRYENLRRLDDTND